MAFEQDASCVLTVKESSRFLKKAAQKFLLRWAMGVVANNANGPRLIKFFCCFLFTKSSLSQAFDRQLKLW
ncbi:hypothetical protein [Acidocella sp.]|jgi:hypothetical protein|uniref:hypothetical protein n=1 Tax=Acidocella sp. TaxID=50710 RepID=UPI002F425248